MLSLLSSRRSDLSKSLKKQNVLFFFFENFFLLKQMEMLTSIKQVQRERFWTAAEIKNGEATQYQVKMEQVVLSGVIGKGGYGQVYKGTYKGQTCAIKSIHIIHQKHKAFLERELDILA